MLDVCTVTGGREARSGARGRTRSRHSLKGGGNAVMVMLTLCGAVTACTANHQRMVPWSEVAAARMRPGWPTTAPGCGANDVRLSFREENGATGTNTLFVAATNISRHAAS